MSTNGHTPDLHIAAPWEQQDSESDKAYQAFCAYRDQDPPNRSIQRAASEIGKGHDLLRKWSAKYGWVERVRLYDRDLARQQMEADRAQSVKMGKRHAGISATLLEVGTKPAIELLRRWKEDPVPFAAQTDDDLFAKVVQFVRVVPALIQAERLSRGQSTAAIDIGAGDVPSGVPAPDNLREWMAKVYAEVEALDLPEPDADEGEPIS